MMLRYSFNLNEEAQSIENAVSRALLEGARTKDIFQGEGTCLGTVEMGEGIRRFIIS